MAPARGRGRGRGRNPKKRKRRVYHRRKVCRFCADKSLNIDYKEPKTLRNFTTERGKIIPRRISGTQIDPGHQTGPYNCTAALCGDP